MKSCSRCGLIAPDESFYRNGSWCDACRRAERAAWKSRNKAHTQIKKLEQAGSYDATAFGKLHCEHIAGYTKRQIEKFEWETGKEAPPELTAMYELAKRLTDQQHAQIVARQVVVKGSRVVKQAPKIIHCLNCGKPVETWSYNRRYCSSTCRYSFAHAQDPDRNRRRRKATA